MLDVHKMTNQLGIFSLPIQGLNLGLLDALDWINLIKGKQRKLFYFSTVHLIEFVAQIASNYSFKLDG